ncbi:hypothetical protein CAOG_05606 [Capsaspora owczarzaki ATCC 30864]|uniref:Uncharacterized protein n=1 Tax=Capsaspora owczarzaki (strain ATCC 30864) TaxID=595528 RepID=A0A0D2X3Y5_CAPO3|nr:hypothetical protein CAOG_05606 [Capsaspora owczarzaki ATCC 30864]KJE95119.1 hypothetical protein CAOG_005606 [Capsaspora owczarzaki ATCC 30864]|eukprot:XP_004346279.1 hypothetical protein CAOG_05606 [Capsaspora owczarzaki ATCC 30864]
MEPNERGPPSYSEATRSVPGGFAATAAMDAGPVIFPSQEAVDGIASRTYTPHTTAQQTASVPSNNRHSSTSVFSTERHAATTFVAMHEPRVFTTSAAGTDFTAGSRNIGIGSSSKSVPPALRIFKQTSLAEDPPLPS